MLHCVSTCLLRSESKWHAKYVQINGIAAQSQSYDGRLLDPFFVSYSTTDRDWISVKVVALRENVEEFAAVERMKETQTATDGPFQESDFLALSRSLRRDGKNSPAADESLATANSCYSPSRSLR